MDPLTTILLGTLGSLLAVAIVALSDGGRARLARFNSRRRLAHQLREEGLTAFHLSRRDYALTLPQYLAKANHTIGIVSISLRLTHDQSNLLACFRERLAQNQDLRVTVSLLAPHSEAAAIVAASLDLPTAQMRRELKSMLNELLVLRASLPDDQRQRLHVQVHELLPMGSAILLDATPHGGRIQVETKLYRAPRLESFGYEVHGPGAFYSRNYRAWTKVVDDSRDVTPEDLA